MGKRGSHMVRKSRDKTTLEAETIGYMPERFITGYHELVRMGLKMEPGAQQFDNESAQVKKKFHQHDGGLKDEQALRFKAWVDRQLRAVGRDVQAYLNARGNVGPSPVGLSPALRREIARELERKTELKCKGCKQYISWQWTHCAWCGRRILDGQGTQQTEVRSDSKQERGEGEPQASANHIQYTCSGTGPDTNPADGAKAGRNDEGTAGADRET